MAFMTLKTIVSEKKTKVLLNFALSLLFVTLLPVLIIERFYITLLTFEEGSTQFDIC